MRKLTLLLCLLLAVTLPALAAAPEQVPTPALTERPESAFLQALLDDLSQQTADPWAQAILSEGAADVRLADGVLSFSLRSFRPGLRYMDTAAADFRARLRARLSAHDLPCTLRVTGDGETLTASSAETKKLMKTVAKVAAAAKKEFGGKAMLAVLLQLLAEGVPLAAPDAQVATPDAQAATPDAQAATPDAQASAPDAQVATPGAQAAAPDAQAAAPDTQVATPGAQATAPDAQAAVPDAQAATSDTQPVASETRYAPLFAAQIRAKLATAGGPHALVLSATFADVDALLTGGYDAARRQLAETGRANALPAGEIARSLTEALTAQAKVLRKRAQNPYAFTVDIDALLADPPCVRDEAYGELLATYAQKFDTRLAWLTTSAAHMPDAPARDMPANGRLSGSVKGTKIICRNKTDGYACYLQFRSTETGVNVLTAFVACGKTIVVRVPEDMYDILLASGDLWYGEPDLFGDEGEYLRLEQLKIPGDEFYCTLTFNNAEYERMAAQDVDPSAFR